MKYHRRKHRYRVDESMTYKRLVTKDFRCMICGKTGPASEMNGMIAPAGDGIMIHPLCDECYTKQLARMVSNSVR